MVGQLRGRKISHSPVSKHRKPSDRINPNKEQEIQNLKRRIKKDLKSKNGMKKEVDMNMPKSIVELSPLRSHINGLNIVNEENPIESGHSFLKSSQDNHSSDNSEKDRLSPQSLNDLSTNSTRTNLSRAQQSVIDSNVAVINASQAICVAECEKKDYQKFNEAILLAEKKLLTANKLVDQADHAVELVVGHDRLGLDSMESVAITDKQANQQLLNTHSNDDTSTARPYYLETSETSVDLYNPVKFMKLPAQKNDVELVQSVLVNENPNVNFESGEKSFQAPINKQNNTEEEYKKINAKSKMHYGVSDEIENNIDLCEDSMDSNLLKHAEFASSSSSITSLDASDSGIDQNNMKPNFLLSAINIEDKSLNNSLHGSETNATSIEINKPGEKIAPILFGFEPEDDDEELDGMKLAIREKIMTPINVDLVFEPECENLTNNDNNYQDKTLPHEEDSLRKDEYGGECKEEQVLLNLTTTTSAEPEKPQFVEIVKNLIICDESLNREPKPMLCFCNQTEKDLRDGFGCDVDCINSALFMECGSRCPNGEFCRNKKFQKQQYAHLELFHAGPKGWGVKAIKDIQKGDFISEYVGEVIDSHQMSKRSRRYSRNPNHRHHYFMALKAGAVIDATMKGNISRFINHSCNPNAETQKWTVDRRLCIGFFATRNIKAGEEVVFNYQFQRFGKKAQKCYCGSSNCTGYIGLKEGEELEDDDDVLPDVIEESESDDEEEEKALVETQNRKRVSKNDGGPPAKRGRKLKNTLEKKLFEKSKLLREITKDVDKFIGKGPIRNHDGVLNFNRLMVRIDDISLRSRMVNHLLASNDENIYRLFIEKFGLTLLWTWLGDDYGGRVDPHELIQFQSTIVFLLDRLPIRTKNQIAQSRLLGLVEKLVEHDLIETVVIKNVLDDMLNRVAAEVEEIETDTLVITNKNDVEVSLNRLKESCGTLLEKWRSLKENFKIPKKDRSALATANENANRFGETSSAQQIVQRRNSNECSNDGYRFSVNKFGSDRQAHFAPNRFQNRFGQFNHLRHISSKVPINKTYEFNNKPSNKESFFESRNKVDNHKRINTTTRFKDQAHAPLEDRFNHANRKFDSPAIKVKFDTETASSSNSPDDKTNSRFHKPRNTLKPSLSPLKPLSITSKFAANVNGEMSPKSKSLAVIQRINNILKTSSESSSNFVDSIPLDEVPLPPPLYAPQTPLVLPPNLLPGLPYGNAYFAPTPIGLVSMPLPQNIEEMDRQISSVSEHLRMLQEYRIQMLNYAQNNNTNSSNMSCLTPEMCISPIEQGTNGSHVTPPVVSSTTVTTVNADLSVIESTEFLSTTSTSVATTSKSANLCENVTTEDKMITSHESLEKETKWIEARDAEGNIYYYHKDTRETVWEIPDETENNKADTTTDRNETRAKFKSQVSANIRLLVEPWRKKKFASNDEFKHFVRKHTKSVVEKEESKHPNGDLQFTESIKKKTKEFIYAVLKKMDTKTNLNSHDSNTQVTNN